MHHGVRSESHGLEGRGWLLLGKRASRRTEIFAPDLTVHHAKTRVLPRTAFIAHLHVRGPAGPADHQTLGTSQLIGTQFGRRQRGTVRTQTGFIRE